MHQWNVYKTFDEASKAAADFIATQIQASIAQNNSCHVILPGGNTPAVCLSYLAKKFLPWNKVHWYPGDERCVPSGHADRNDVMLEKNLWSHLDDTHAHIIPAELGAEEAASVYRDMISHIKQFDIAFLGLGEDGHTASLFPDNKALNDTRSVVPVYHSPKPPAERVSLSMSTLRNTPCRIVLVGGPTKAEIIARIKQGETLPINSLGDIYWYLDEAAVGTTE
ncbi:MAG: 6-phosphogluconolactonase [Gammaproteobacteria bacterium]|nr:6-phosphogluconolactonase [Gammaproteobacteria bacterium]